MTTANLRTDWPGAEAMVVNLPAAGNTTNVTRGILELLSLETALTDLIYDEHGRQVPDVTNVLSETRAANKSYLELRGEIDSFLEQYGFEGHLSYVRLDCDSRLIEDPDSRDLLCLASPRRLQGTFRSRLADNLRGFNWMPRRAVYDDVARSMVVMELQAVEPVPVYEKRLPRFRVPARNRQTYHVSAMEIISSALDPNP